MGGWVKYVDAAVRARECTLRKQAETKYSEIVVYPYELQCRIREWPQYARANVRSELVKQYATLLPRDMDEIENLSEHYLIDGIMVTMRRQDGSYDRYGDFISRFLYTHESASQKMLTMAAVAMFATRCNHQVIRHNVMQKMLTLIAASTFAKKCNDQVVCRRQALMASLRRLADSINTFPQAYATALEAEVSDEEEDEKDKE